MPIQRRNFIVIDDNKLDCFIAKKVILNTGISDKISVFLDAKEALEFIIGNGMDDNHQKSIIIVDIQMPNMNGFEFVEAFETLHDTLKVNYLIFMLSSSINENDLNRIRNYKSVKQIIHKPLSVKKITVLLEQEM